jgi:hypothetical protein
MAYEKATILVYGTDDNMRRGNPLPGCDCVQCFGHCIIDHDLAHRVLMERSEQVEHGSNE